jgi:uncharacterized protein (TIGR02145 family)
MAQNLNYPTIGGSKCYNNSDENCNKYGRLYDWKTAMNSSASSNTDPSGVVGVCPPGWHLPSNAEWSTLGTDIISNSTKIRATTDWTFSSGIKNTDDYGFSALPAGRYLTGENLADRFSDLQMGTFWWTSQDVFQVSSGIQRYMLYNDSELKYLSGLMTIFMSVRCIETSQ